MTNLAFYRPVQITTKKLAESICGTLSKPSKMPCHGFSIPAEACHVGSKLRTIPGSVCSNCYALKGRYRFPNVQKAMMFRLANLYHPQWVEAMTFLIRQTGEEYFRWHDSGDIQSLAHLMNIVSVADALRTVRFWLPTRERSIVAEYRRGFGVLPGNLVARVSAAMVGGNPPGTSECASTVHRPGACLPGVHECPAHRQGNQCGDCRACWDPAVAAVSYLEH